MTENQLRTVSLEQVRQAQDRLKGRIRTTPILDLPPGPNGELVSVKLEFLQLSGSFKARGATNRIALDEGRHGRVTAVSGGNHGAGVALAGRTFGLPVDIFLPKSSPVHKLKLIESLGAELHLIDGTFPDAVEACARFTETHDALFVHPFDDPGTIAGQGTLGLEVMAQRPDTAAVVVSVGGGGLAAGITVALNGAARVVAAEPVTCRSLAAALEAGEPTRVEVGGLSGDALGAPVIGEIAFNVLSAAGDPVVEVTEDDLVVAQQDVWDRLRLCVEPAAACAWAAAFKEGVIKPGERVVVVLCGSNVDPREWSSVVGR